MRNILMFVIAVFIVCNGIAQPSADKHLKKFAVKFSKAVLSGKPENCLPYFDKDYVREQHDVFLKGNTMQFVSEFIYGFSEISPELSDLSRSIFYDIREMAFSDILQDKYGQVTIIYTIILKDGQNITLSAPVIIYGKRSYALRGAMG
jgi:hypothetical protein